MPYLVGVFAKRKDKAELIDIMKTEEFETLDQCTTKCVELSKTDKLDHKKAMDEYAERLKDFVIDETVEDTEPIQPMFNWYYYIPQLLTRNQINQLP